MPVHNLIQIFSLPEVKILHQRSSNRYVMLLEAFKDSAFEVCPKCATSSYAIYDRRKVKIKDAPIRDKKVILWIQKRRFYCKSCRKPFTEPIAGIKKGHRTTERLARTVLHESTRVVTLKAVQRGCGVSPGYTFRTVYRMLELKRRMHNQYPWPRTIGIDEHSFRKNKGTTEFVSVLIDFKNDRVFEVVDGKSEETLRENLATIAGKQNVKNVVIDMCDAFRNFAKNNFVNAKLTIDKFHVLRLISRAFNRCRKQKIGHLKSNPQSRILFKPEDQLEWKEKFQIAEMIHFKGNENLKGYYNVYQSLHRLYKTRGYKKAKKKLEKIIVTVAQSQLKPIITLGETLTKWKEEILNYFSSRLTNAKTEGFNGLCKLLQRRAFGFKSFKNYRLRVLHACW